MPAIVHQTIFHAGAGRIHGGRPNQRLGSEIAFAYKMAYLPSYGMVRLRLTDWTK
jgi:hypothetical protein